MRGIVITLALGIGVAAAQPRFTIRELPSPDGPADNRVVWVGPNGEMTGSIGYLGTVQCYGYEDGSFTLFDTPGQRCYTNAANASGETVGTLHATPPVRPDPTVRLSSSFVIRGGELQELPMPARPGVHVSVNSAGAINAKGEIAGYYQWFDDNGATISGWIYADGEYRFAPDLGGGNTVPVAINDSGDMAIVGYSAPPIHPVALILTSSGKMIDLGSLGGWYMLASDLNNEGQAVGAGTTTFDVNSPYMAFFYTGSVVMPVTFPGARSTGLSALNDRGDAVGSYQVRAADDTDTSRALFYRDGHTWDLNELLIRTPEDIVLQGAHVITEEGRIIATGTVGQSQRTVSFLLTPEGDPDVFSPRTDVRRR